MAKTYEEQLQEQIDQYRDTEEMHDLPPVFHLWSSASILPGLHQVFGATDITGFYVEAFTAATRSGEGTPTFLSLGCGDGATEIAVGRGLLARGLNSFRFVCYDLSDILLDRFRASLPPELADSFSIVTGDLNAHTFDVPFDAVMANHSLHHMVDLEGIFRTVYDNLTPGGVFVTSDMIGRNGHMRWPETKLFVDFFWPFLTQRQRRNVLLRRAEPAFIDHDCSDSGFEGVRAQDVLPTILKQGFHPWKFLGFGGMVDVFIDRCFGPNFDVTDPDDAFLARRIGFLNEILLDSGLVKPTMVLAWFTKTPRDDTVVFRNRTAEAAVRDTAANPPWLAAALNDFARCQDTPEYVFREKPAPSPPPLPEPPADDGELRTAQAELRSARAEAASLLLALRHQQDQVDTTRATANAYAKRIADLENSSSWQLTGPLRVLFRLFRR